MPTFYMVTAVLGGWFGAASTLILGHPVSLAVFAYSGAGSLFMLLAALAIALRPTYEAGD
ncbi:hypothetical protein [Pseudotabrizicola sp.]|uniref:hypothetical protein n=1 Tax=Pseudotabrizicola sp. TaxID=2939647 RepID=UPI002ACE3EEB|nr:hypothetical protein [Pseudotabrizicola sp.]